MSEPKSDFKYQNISTYPQREQDPFGVEIRRIKKIALAIPELFEMAGMPKIENMGLHNPDSILLRDLKEQITGEHDHDPFLTGLNSLMFNKREKWLCEMLDVASLITEADDYYDDEFFYIALFFMRRGVQMQQKYGDIWVARIIEGRKANNPTTYKPEIKIETKEQARVILDG